MLRICDRFVAAGVTAFGLIWSLAETGWRGTLWSIAGLLAWAEPLVRFVLLGLALLTCLVAVLFHYSGVAPQLPAGLMAGFAGSMVVLLLLYRAILRTLKR